MTYKTFTRKKALPAKEPRQCLFPDVSMFCKGYASFKRDSLKAYIPPTSGYSHSMVAGGLLVMSYTTRFTPSTSLMIRLEVRPNSS